MTMPPARRRVGRSLLITAGFVLAAALFIGGVSALLYWLFSQYTGIRSVWILVCGAPALLALVVLFTIFRLYMRFGRPLEGLFDAINAVEAGDLAARAPLNRSDMFSELIERFNKMVGELERAEQQRRNLTADIAHELRTPLHIVQGNLEGILDGVYEATPEHLNATLDETRLLTRLVNDLQTLSLAETGHLPLHPTHFLLADLIEDLHNSFAAQASARGVELHAQAAQPERQIAADYDRLNQALSNLIANALRHTPPGGRVAIIAEAGERPEAVRIVVRDSGEGIPPEDLAFIFDRFWRGDRSRHERTHSGLGLAITRQLIHAHGGRIEVDSSVEVGTTFTIELPG